MPFALCSLPSALRHNSAAATLSDADSRKLDPGVSKFQHRLRVIDGGFGRDEARRFRIAGQAQRMQKYFIRCVSISWEIFM